MPIPTFRELWQDIKQWRVGNKRVAAYGGRGRTYAPRKPEPAAPTGPAHSAKGEPLGTVRARVFHKSTGEWEDLGVIAEADMDIINQIRATPKE